MKYFIANWKSNMSKEDVLAWLEIWTSKMQKTRLSDENTKAIIAPSTVHLQFINEVLQKSMVSAQNVSEFAKGPHTGISCAFQIKDYCKYCIVGHSDLKETKEIILKKAQLCIENNITPIICFIKPENAKEFYVKDAVLVWEDPNNISKNQTYKAKDSKEIETQIKSIKNILPEETKVLYGGSVNNKNIKDLKKIEELDGVLVGNASLDPNHFWELITL